MTSDPVVCLENEFQLPADLHYLNCAYMSPQHRCVAEARMAGLLRKNDHTTLGVEDLFGESDRVRTLFVTGPAPVVGAVGPLQFDVLLHRLEHEYGVKGRLEPMPYRDARWVRGPEREIVRVARGHDCALVWDRNDRPLLEGDLEFLRVALD